MALCPDCVQAERDPLWAVFRGEPCCTARSIVELRPKSARAAFAQAVKRAVEPQEWTAILARIRVLQAREAGVEQ